MKIILYPLLGIAFIIIMLDVHETGTALWGYGLAGIVATLFWYRDRYKSLRGYVGWLCSWSLVWVAVFLVTGWTLMALLRSLQR